MRKLATLLASLLALMLAPAASPAPGLLVGAADDTIKWSPASTAAVANDLGLRVLRITVHWEPGQTELTPSQVAELDGAVAAAGTTIRLVPIVHSRNGDDAPADVQSADQYCGFVGSLLQRYPSIRDVAIWVEPNKSFFWKPQFHAGQSAAPVAYAALLSRCWDVLHAARPDVNVIAASTSPRGNDRADAVSNVSHSPGEFIRQMGIAHRVMARKGRLFDTVSHHVYGERSSERPWRVHAGSSTISQGDWQALMQALYDAFDGTDQPIPGEDGVQIWYTEVGYQTTIDPAKQALYHGVEADPSPVAPAPGGFSPTPWPAADSAAADQGTQLADGIRLAYCQPYVGAYLNLLLADEPVLERWQSGVLWTDGTRKPSYATLRALTAAVAASEISCDGLDAVVSKEFEPKSEVGVSKIWWSVMDVWAARNTLWRMRIKVDEDAYWAGVILASNNGKWERTLSARRPKIRRVALRANGQLKAGYFSFVKFPERRLKPGRYVMRITLRARANPSRVTIVTGKPFTVRAPRSKAR